MSTTEIRPPFGCHDLQPDGLKAVYGGRWIVRQDGDVDILWDRHGVEGEHVAALLLWLNGEDGKGALHEAREGASDLLKRYVMRTREECPFILYQDDKGAIVGNTRASCGYLYVTGWLYDDLTGDETVGLTKWADASVARIKRLEAEGKA